MTEDDLRRLLRQVRAVPHPNPMAERLMEMYREWCRQGVFISGNQR